MSVSDNLHSIKGKTVLIAGGAKNLGGLIARDMARQGPGRWWCIITVRPQWRTRT